MSQAIERLTSRAARAALKPNTLGTRAGDLPADTIVVPLETHLLISGKTQRSLQKDINRITSELHKTERGLEHRKESLVKAHEYIKDLKARIPPESQPSTTLSPFLDWGGRTQPKP